jgi:hypothetical protein
MFASMLAHILGIPIEENAATIAPLATASLGAIMIGRERLRAQGERWRRHLSGRREREGAPR